MKIKKFLFVITTMFLMVQGASAWNGSGSSGDPYLIASTADWNTLASNVANGNTYSNTYFKLTADITVTTMVTATFSGTFELSTTPRQEIMLHPLHILQVQLSRTLGWLARLTADTSLPQVL